MTLTVDDLREHVGGALSDEALQLLLDSAYEAIAEAIGPVGNRKELHPRMHGPLLMLARPADSIVSIVEGLDEVTLDPDDYELRPSGQTLLRLDSGPNPRRYWDCTDTEYVPQTTDVDRDRVAIQLVKLDVTYQPALASQSSDAWSESYGPTGIGEGGYDERRMALLSSLGGGAGFVR